MQIILLSGGSGKRLWPLSNKARSKQFLYLLPKEDGTMESMVQRVVRQAGEAGLHADITVATNASQQDIITNQLGDRVTVVTEPERRGTFPAIALTTAYLKLEKGCTDDEVVVVMPCDAYTQRGYFEAVRQMAAAVEQDEAPLVLMGITPTYPSAKYGYVVPGAAGSGTCCPVARFAEKPSVDQAQQLIHEGALWNGGVFAFRLGHLFATVQRYVPFTRFDELRRRFGELPYTSFDCEVVERATGMGMVHYDGEWKDLGTWRTLTDELRTHVIGNAVMGEHCQNTHVINELQNPLYVDGLKDVVVAACPDGILVCSKQHAELIKQAVSQLTPRPMYEERRWGTYRVLDDTMFADGRHALTKSITINAGKNISYQVHHHRAETWTFVEGEGIFLLDGVERRVSAGETVVIPVGHLHAIKAITPLTFIEVQCGHPLIEEDIERFEWHWSE